VPFYYFVFLTLGNALICCFLCNFIADFYKSIFKFLHYMADGNSDLRAFAKVRDFNLAPGYRRQALRQPGDVGRYKV
jgi:hypothetical protein